MRKPVSQDSSSVIRNEDEYDFLPNDPKEKKTKKDKKEDKNIYIADGNRAITLLSEIITTKKSTAAQQIDELRKTVQNIFDLFDRVNLQDEVPMYQTFMGLCDRLEEHQKIVGKRIIGVGGQFSSGKSAFLNSISGCGSLLPEAQNPTTSIPTYLLKAPEKIKKPRYVAHTTDGHTIQLTAEKLGALSHEFYNTYQINLSSFIDSITIEATEFLLSEKIALLDTPGYSKADDQSDTKAILTDREKARQQLASVDDLIWLIDIENGTLHQSDIDMIRMIDPQNPILIVLNKADKKTEDEMQQIRKNVLQTAQDSGLELEDVALYDSHAKREYTNGIISKFFARTSGTCDNIKDMFETVIKSLEASLNEYKADLNQRSTELQKAILNCNNVLYAHNLSLLWKQTQLESYSLEDRTPQVEQYIIKLRDLLAQIGI